MKKVFFLFLLTTHIISSQEIVFKKSLPNKQEFYEYAIIDFVEKDSTVYLNYENESSSLLSANYTKDLKPIDDFKAYKFSESCINFLSSFTSEKKAIFMFANNASRKFRAVTLDLENDSISDKLLDFRIKKEKLVGTFSHKDKFHFLTFVKNTKTFRIHTLDTKLNVTTKAYDITNGTYSLNGKLQTPKDANWVNSVLKFDLSGFQTNYKAKFINTNTVNSNAIVTQSSKLYLNDNVLILSLDGESNFTSLIEFNLDDNSTATKQYAKKHFAQEEVFFAKSNSIIFNDKIFNIKGNKNKITLRIRDLKTDSLISEFNFDKNTPYYKKENIIVSNEIIETYKLPKPEKQKDEIVKIRLRKLMRANNHIGLRVLEDKDTYFISIGAYLEGSSGMPMMGMPGFGSFGLAFSHTFVNDESLNLHINKKDLSLTYRTHKHPYDKMDDFIKEQNDNTVGVKKFKINHSYYLSYYDTNEEALVIRMF